MRIRRTLLAAGLVAAATTAVVPRGADAASLVIVTASTAQGFILPTTPLLQGMGLDYTNVDPIAPHNVVSDVAGLFSSGRTVSAGTTKHVVGVETLAPGSYAFHCDLHGSMKGTLEVLPVADPTAGSPPAQPPLVAAPGVVGGVATPTAITVHGDSMYAASFGANTVYKLPILPTGLLGPAVAYATGFSAPAGIVFGSDGTLFVSDSHASTRTTPGRATDGRVWAIPAGGGDAAVVGQKVIDGLPNGRHNTNNLAVKSGRLYITNGNSTDNGVDPASPEEALSGTLLSVDASARGLAVNSPTDMPVGLVVEAKGMRNVYDVAFRPGTTEAWLPMNGPDTFDPFGYDVMNVADVAGAAPDFGFPNCLYGVANAAGGTNVTTPDGKVFSYIQNTTPGISGSCDAGSANKLPEQLLGLHTSADGLAFTADGKAVYVALFGNFFGSQVVGHKVVKLAIDAAGHAGPMQDVVSLAAAPLDVTLGPAGMYVADFASGQISLIRS